MKQKIQCNDNWRVHRSASQMSRWESSENNTGSFSWLRNCLQRLIFQQRLGKHTLDSFFVKLWSGMKTHYALEREAAKWEKRDVEVLFRLYNRLLFLFPLHLWKLLLLVPCALFFFNMPLMTSIKACLIFEEFLCEDLKNAFCFIEWNANRKISAARGMFERVGLLKTLGKENLRVFEATWDSILSERDIIAAQTLLSKSVLNS